MAPFPSPTPTWHNKTYPSLSPVRAELSAKGKSVVVTGGGTGIGAETARRFAEAGASRIALLGRREQPLFDTKASIEREFAGVEVFVASTDVVKRKEVNAAFSQFAGDGRIDVLVSNAAIEGPKESVADADPDTFLDAIHQSLRGSMNVAQAFLRYRSAKAVVIDVSSNAAHVNFAPVYASYSIAKLAIFRLWDSLADAHPELSVFHLQPGIVDTEMNRRVGGVKAAGFQDDGKRNDGFNK